MKISSALATEGASAVGAEISMESPASFIAPTTDLPYEMNLMFSYLNSGWFSNNDFTSAGLKNTTASYA